MEHTNLPASPEGNTLLWRGGGSDGDVGVTRGCLLLYPGGVNVSQSPVERERRRGDAPDPDALRSVFLSFSRILRLYASRTVRGLTDYTPRGGFTHTQPGPRPPLANISGYGGLFHLIFPSPVFITAASSTKDDVCLIEVEVTLCLWIVRLIFVFEPMQVSKNNSK